MNKHEAFYNYIKLVYDNGCYYDCDDKSNYITMANGKKYFYNNIPYFAGMLKE